MKDTTIPGHPATRRAQWAEPDWRERLYSLSLLPEADSVETLRRMAVGWQPIHGWSLPPSDMPFIHLAAFTGREAMEETLTRWIQRICLTLPRFNLSLAQPSLLPDDSIGMRVAENACLQKLVGRLDVLETYIRSCGTGGVEWIRTPCCRFGKATTPKGRPDTPAIETGNQPVAIFPVHCLILEKRTHAEDGGEKVYLCPLSP